MRVYPNSGLKSLLQHFAGKASLFDPLSGALVLYQETSVAVRRYHTDLLSFVKFNPELKLGIYYKTTFNNVKLF